MTINLGPEDVLSPRQQNVILLVWYVFLAFCVAGVFLLTHASGAELSISGNCSGTGAHVMEVEGVHLENLTVQEAMYVLGPAHNFNITRDGLLTFENGSSWHIVEGSA